MTKIISKPPTKEYRENYERIFSEKKCAHCGHLESDHYLGCMKCEICGTFQPSIENRK